MRAGVEARGWLNAEVAVNMLLARIAFDLLRSDAFRDKVRVPVCCRQSRHTCAP